MKKKLEQFYRALSGHPDIELLWDEPMSKHTTFKIGGPARLMCVLKTTNVVINAVKNANDFGIEPFIIGNGSNLLVDDEGIPGVVLKISGANWHRNEDSIIIDAGTPLTKAASLAKRMELSGFEFAYGIPGTMGGAVYMNAGAYDSEMKNVVTKTKFIDRRGNTYEISGEKHEFGYRTSFFKTHPEYTILCSTVKLQYGKADEIEAKMQDFMGRRRSKQPLEFPSAGSVFKRPEGHFAGALIEQCGLKGYTIGGAQVSEKHAGFIVNKGNATCKEVRLLIEHIQETVLRECGVSLECEVLCAPYKK